MLGLKEIENNNACVCVCSCYDELFLLIALVAFWPLFSHSFPKFCSSFIYLFLILSFCLSLLTQSVCLYY